MGQTAILGELQKVRKGEPDPETLAVSTKLMPIKSDTPTIAETESAWSPVSHDQPKPPPQSPPTVMKLNAACRPDESSMATCDLELTRTERFNEAVLMVDSAQALNFNSQSVQSAPTSSNTISGCSSSSPSATESGAEIVSLLHSSRIMQRGMLGGYDDDGGNANITGGYPRELSIAQGSSSSDADVPPQQLCI